MWRPSGIVVVSSATTALPAGGHGRRKANWYSLPPARMSRQRRSPIATGAWRRPSTTAYARYRPAPRSVALNDSPAVPESAPGAARSPCTPAATGANASCSTTRTLRTSSAAVPAARHGCGPPHTRIAHTLVAPSPSARTQPTGRLTDGTSCATHRTRPSALAPNSVFQSPLPIPDTPRSKSHALIVVSAGAV